MTINRFALKAQAKARLGEVSSEPILPTLVYLVITILLAVLQNSLDGRFTKWGEQLGEFLVYNAARPELTSVIALSALFAALLTLVSSVFTAGYVWYTMGLARSEPVSLITIFDGVNYLFKIVLLNILIYVFTVLWSLLLFFPGVIASYRYRLALYIMRDHPDYSALQCIRESKRMMYGYKMDLFILDVSFIGWALLFTISLGVVAIFYLPYVEMTYVYFYERALKYPVIPRPEASPDDGANPGGF